MPYSRRLFSPTRVSKSSKKQRFACVSEAKKDDFEKGLAQCLVEMQVCAERNILEYHNITLFGIVTNGSTWQFYKRDISGVVYESSTYGIFNIELILAILDYIFAECERNMNRSKTARCKCKACAKTFTIDPKTRKTSHEKEALVEDALRRGLSQRQIASTLHMSRTTIRQFQRKIEEGLVSKNKKLPHHVPDGTVRE
jgi:hypothetical protein